MDVTRCNTTATDVEGIEFRNSPGNGRAICLGQVSVRKRQSLVADLVKGTEAIVDFVGPNDLEPLPVSLPSQFLGEWSRGELSQNLTNYSAMVLYSRAEAHAMVVMEGLAAGLSVVVSPQSAANLDLSRPFIYVVDKDADLAPTIEKAVAENPALRAQARTYAEEHFAWPARATTLESHLLGWDAD